MDESGTDEVECSRKVASGNRVAGVIRSLHLECARVLHEPLVPVLRYDSETMIWNEKERSKIWDVEMDNLRGLLSIRRMDKVPNTGKRQLCGVTESVDEKIDECIHQWFGHMERIEKDRDAKRVYVGECAGCRSVGRPRKK